METVTLAEVSFGEWLKRRRNTLGLTQEQLALQISCSTSALRKMEAEERRPSAQVIERLAEIFNIPHNERTAFLRFARGDWRAAFGETREDIPWRVSTKAPRSNLPAALTSLVGREQEIADISEYLHLAQVRLVTLVGPPGIGKTRLSIEAARASLQDFPDGIFFVALAPLDNPALIALAIAQALGYVGATKVSTQEQLKDGIGNKHMLLVLDNCEHLVEGVSSLASKLLSVCSRLKILATSRESLRIAGEWLYPVPGFDIPKDISSMNVETASNLPGLTLFVQRARAVRPDFTLNADNIQVILAICAQLDGLPLAIELIAARMRLMSPQALLERLSDQFILSADGMRAASPRQKTLNDAIGWSYNLLSTEEQKLFTYLSVFSGGFTFEAAEAIFSRTAAEKPISNLITSLLDKSLLQRLSEQEASGEPRYTMLVTIREFARVRLRQIDEEAKIRNWHLAYFLELSEKADQELRGHHQLEWLSRLNSDRDNFHTALEWAIETRQTETALQMARKLDWFFSVRGDHNEGRHWLGRVLALPDAPLYPEAYAQALIQIAHHTWLQTGPEKARPFVEQALSIARAHGDKWNTARALAMLGLVLTDENSFEAAQTMLEESKALFQEVDDKWGFAHAVIVIARGFYIKDDRAISLALHEQALLLFREVGDRYFQSAALRFIGNLQVLQGNWVAGAAALRDALTIAQQLGSKFEIGLCLWSLADAAKPAGNPARAVQLYWAAKIILDSISAWQEMDDPKFEDRLAICRAALSETEFATAIEQGRATTMEQAIAYAIENNNE